MTLSNPITLANAVANAMLAVSSCSFIIFAFGRPSELWKMSPFQALMAKAGLSATCAGAVLNVATLSTPQLTEVILNFGLAITCTWANWWHWTNHLHKQLEEYKRPPKKQKSTRGQIKKAPSFIKRRSP
jgi:hypothetical protein